jgi:hypothetical protein
MNTTAKTLTLEIIRILTGLVFILGAILKLYPIAPLEILLVKINICNWYWAPIIARLLIGFEIALGSLLLLKIYLKQTLSVSLITLIGFTLFLLYFKFILGKDDNCGCFGEAVQLNPVESILKNLLLIALIIYSIIENRSRPIPPTKYRRLLFPLTLITSFSIPFIVNAISLPGEEGNYVIKPGMFVTADKFKDVRFNGDSVNLLEGRKLICFLSLKCKTCKYAATKLTVLYKKHNNALPIYFIFLDIEDRETALPQFMKETEAKDIPYAILGAEQFMKVSDASLPFIMYLDNGEIKNLSNFDDMDPDAIIDFFEGKKP